MSMPTFIAFFGVSPSSVRKSGSARDHIRPPQGKASRRRAFPCPFGPSSAARIAQSHPPSARRPACGARAALQPRRIFKGFCGINLSLRPLFILLPSPRSHGLRPNAPSSAMQIGWHCCGEGVDHEPWCPGRLPPLSPASRIAASTLVLTDPVYLVTTWTAPAGPLRPIELSSGWHWLSRPRLRRFRKTIPVQGAIHGMPA